MTPLSRPREPSHAPRVIVSNYRTISTTARSSSSSSTSGVTTPVDSVPPVLVAFPKPLPSTAGDGLTSSGSSSLSLDKHHHHHEQQQQKPLQLSFTKAPVPFVTRLPKLSLDSSKARPIPASPSAASDSAALALGAFSPTASAESHLRSIVSRASRSRAASMSLSSSTSSKEEDVPTPPGISRSSRLRTSSLRSLTLPWPEAKHNHTKTHERMLSKNVLYDIENDDEESGDDAETEAFWPRHHDRTQAYPHPHSDHPPTTQSAQRTVPSISRTPSPSTINVTTVPHSRLRTQSASASVSASAAFPSNPNSHPHPPSRLGPGADARKPKRPVTHVRAFTEPALSAFSRNNTNATASASKLPSSSASARPLRSFIGPPRSKGRANSISSGLPGVRPPHTISSVLANADASESGSMATLNSALAAVETASRLRARCVCGVCGKAGVDYPRCTRCSATWCSRQCRVSSAAAGGARHTCIGNGAGAGTAYRTKPATITLSA